MKKLLLLPFLLPLFVVAQNGDSWELYLNKQKIASSGFKDKEPIAIPSNARGFLKLVYSGTMIENEWKRSLIITNCNRRELMRSNISSNSGIMKIQLNTLRDKTSNNTFTISTMAIPTDSKRASLIKVRTVELCTINWK